MGSGVFIWESFRWKRERGFIIKREIVMSKMKFGISLFKSDHLTRVFFVGSGLIQKKAIVFVK